MRHRGLIAIGIIGCCLAAAILIGCNGGGDSDSASNTIGININLNEPLEKTARSIDAARLLTQASFGVSHTSLAKVLAHNSLESWIDQQIALPATLQLPDVQAYGNASLRSPRHYVWWNTALTAEDQLRQRVAFALSEIFVVSDIDYSLGNSQYGMVSYYDMLASNAFANFRDLLEDVTLHPVMGIYLSMVRNEKADLTRNIRPDENFAREVMQLFTIGLYQLDAGGEPIPLGRPEPAYTQKDIEEYARVFTGWNFADSPEWQSSDLTRYDKITPMVPQEAFHDADSKQLLGGVIAPAGLGVADDLALALDTLFTHPNVGPFIAKSLIQRLVSSNPSKAYVTRAAAVFNDNGLGVRGDMGALVKAILLDEEARQGSELGSELDNELDGNAMSTNGKFKEPLLRATHLLRALNAVPGPGADGQFHMYSKTADSVGDIFGQSVLSSPSVFNFFSPDFLSPIEPAGDNQTPVYTPELQILTESLVSAANNDLHSMIYSANNRADPKGRSAVINIDAPIMMLRKGRDTYLDHMNVLLMSGTMSSAMQAVLADYIDEQVAANRIELPPDEEADETEETAAMENDDEDETDSSVGDNAETDGVSDVDLQLAQFDDSVLETMVLDSLFMMLASPEFMVQL